MNNPWAPRNQTELHSKKDDDDSIRGWDSIVESSMLSLHSNKSNEIIQANKSLERAMLEMQKKEEEAQQVVQKIVPKKRKKVRRRGKKSPVKSPQRTKPKRQKITPTPAYVTPTRPQYDFPAGMLGSSGLDDRLLVIDQPTNDLERELQKKQAELMYKEQEVELFKKKVELAQSLEAMDGLLEQRLAQLQDQLEEEKVDELTRVQMDFDAEAVAIDTRVSEIERTVKDLLLQKTSLEERSIYIKRRYDSDIVSINRHYDDQLDQKASQLMAENETKKREIRLSQMKPYHSQKEKKPVAFR
ncbi:hypothetical protein PCE1_003552 [Barthelona sp. PCE]